MRRCLHAAVVGLIAGYVVVMAVGFAMSISDMMDGPKTATVFIEHSWEYRTYYGGSNCVRVTVQGEKYATCK